MRTCDVLIVGGGPGGSSCAWRLRRAGADVLVIDRKAFPRDKVCAGWITPQVVETLHIDTAEYARGRVFQPITGFRTGVLGGAEVLSRYDRPMSYGIRRCEFDHYLLARSGARVVDGEPVRSLQRRGGRWLVNGEIEAALVVGAGGHFCPVARSLGARQLPGSLVVAAQEIEFAVTPQELARGSVRGDTPELFFCDDLLGYGWCFRKGGFLNIGLGRTDAEGLTAHVAALVEFLKNRGKVRCSVPARFHGHAYQLYERVVPTLVADATLLVGDAAGLAYPQSGEGIRPAVESGLLAAEVIAAAAGDYARGRLEPYARLIASRFGAPRAGSASDWLPAAWLRFAAARLLASRTFAKRVVLERWFLHAREPALRLAEPSPLAESVRATS
jgi:geranylgeranyl reductase family protein